MARQRNPKEFLQRLDATITDLQARHDAVVARFAKVDPAGHAAFTKHPDLRGSIANLLELLASMQRRWRAVPNPGSTTIGEITMATTKFRLRFTIDGNYVGDPIRPPGGVDQPVNDVHFEFNRGTQKPKMSFTENGEVMKDGTREAPDDATGAGVEFGEDERGQPRIKWVHWTRLNEETGEREPIGFEWAPPGADDFHLELGKGGLITKAWWTHDGHELAYGGDVRIPKYPVNDVHLVPEGSFALASIDYERLAVALLATLGARVGYTLGGPLAEPDEPPPIPERYLKLVILYLYAIRETFDDLNEADKEHMRRQLRVYRRQVENSTTLTPEEKADLTAKIDEMLRRLG